MNGEILAFGLYFVAIIGVGIYFFLKDRKSGGEQDYFIGGRAMGPWVTAMSAQASDMSAWLLMGLPGSIMTFGFGQMWIVSVWLWVQLPTGFLWLSASENSQRLQVMQSQCLSI